MYKKNIFYYNSYHGSSPSLPPSLSLSLLPPISLSLALVFCLFYAIDGVVRERGFEILAIPVAIVTVLIYIVGNYIYQKHERKEPFRIVSRTTIINTVEPLIEDTLRRGQPIVSTIAGGVPLYFSVIYSTLLLHMHVQISNRK